MALDRLSLHTEISVYYTATNQAVVIVVSRPINGEGLGVFGISALFLRHFGPCLPLWVSGLMLHNAYFDTVNLRILLINTNTAYDKATFN